MKISFLILILIASQKAIAWNPLSDIDKSILREASQDIKFMSSETKSSIKAYKAMSICQTKCSVCFDGLSCDFECVKKVCLNESGEAK